MDGQELEASQTMIYLGITVDEGLLWYSHINGNVMEAKRTLNFIRVLAKASRGPSSASLLRVSEAMIITVLN